MPGADAPSRRARRRFAERSICHRSALYTLTLPLDDVGGHQLRPVSPSIVITTTARTPLPRRRRILFRSLLLLSPIFVLLALEAAARLAWPDTERDPFVSLEGRATSLTRRVVDGVEMFVFTHPHAYAKESGVQFAVRKPSGTVRVLAFGGSANAGYPHRPPQRWTDYLERALAHAFPDRRFEVINLGAHACASYRVRMIFDDAIDCGPDAVVLYSGNNEFVEKRSYFLDYPGKGVVEALKARSVFLTKVGQWWSAHSVPDNVLSGTERTDANHHLWTHTERIASALRSDPEQYEGVKQHYRYSIEHMVAACERRGIPVFLLTVPVNLRDWSPAVSSSAGSQSTGAPGVELAAPAFQAAYDEGRAKLLHGDATGALIALDRAVQIEPEHADAHFRRGKALDALGRREEAYAAYTVALDQDRNPFRAAPPFNAIICDVAAAHDGAHLVDAVAAFRAAADFGVPGFDLMLDYVHPSRAGNLVLARAVFTAMVTHGIGGGSMTGSSQATFALDDDGYRDDDDEVVQLNLLALFGIMHQYEAYLEKADAFEALIGKRGHRQPAAVQNVLTNTRRAFREYLDEQRKEILGEPFDPGYRARHAEFYKQFFLFTSELKGALVEPEWEKAAAGK